MARAPMKAVRDKVVCSRASQEARMVNGVIGVNTVLARPSLAPQARTCNSCSSEGAQMPRVSLIVDRVGFS